MKVNKLVQFIGRLIASIVVIGITAFFTPGFRISYLWILLLTIASLTLFDFFIGSFTRLYYHPVLKFMIGAVLSGICLYLVQYFTIGYVLSIVSIILGAITYGLVDYMLPNEDVENKAYAHN